MVVLYYIIMIMSWKCTKYYLVPVVGLGDFFLNLKLADQFYSTQM